MKVQTINYNNLNIDNDSRFINLMQITDSQTSQYQDEQSKSINNMMLFNKLLQDNNHVKTDLNSNNNNTKIKQYKKSSLIGSYHSYKSYVNITNSKKLVYSVLNTKNNNKNKSNRKFIVNIPNIIGSSFNKKAYKYNPFIAHSRLLRSNFRKLKLLKEHCFFNKYKRNFLLAKRKLNFSNLKKFKAEKNTSERLT